MKLGKVLLVLYVTVAFAFAGDEQNSRNSYINITSDTSIDQENLYPMLKRYLPGNVVSLYGRFNIESGVGSIHLTPGEDHWYSCYLNYNNEGERFELRLNPLTIQSVLLSSEDRIRSASGFSDSRYVGHYVIEFESDYGLRIDCYETQINIDTQFLNSLIQILDFY